MFRHTLPQIYFRFFVVGNELEHVDMGYVDAAGVEQHEDDGYDEDDDDDDDEEDEDGEDEHANAVAPQAALAGNAQNPEHNHNWIDWDRAADDLTWERLLGLDGSLQFVEHVFWVVTLNTLFILIFAYAPYHLGKIIVSSELFRRTIADTKFTKPIMTLTAYGKRLLTFGLACPRLDSFRLCQCTDWLYFHFVFSSRDVHRTQFCQLSHENSPTSRTGLHRFESGLTSHPRDSSLSIHLWHLARRLFVENIK